MHRKARFRQKNQFIKVDYTEICTTSLSKHIGKGGRPGFCVENRAPGSVVGLKESRRIFNRSGRSLKFSPSNRSFRFADSLYESLGLVTIPLETPPGIPTIGVSLDVISADVPELLGMDVMDNHSLTPCTMSNRLIRRKVLDNKIHSHSYTIGDWSVPLKRYEGHLYAHMSIPFLTFFSKPQLLKLHRHFFHLSSENFYNLLKNARPEDTTPETQQF